MVRTAEACANTIATTLAPSMVIRVLAPLIQTGEYPLNLAAVKMLTRLVETCGRDPVYDFLPDLMPGLIQVSMQCRTKSVVFNSRLNSWKCTQSLRKMFSNISLPFPWKGKINHDSEVSAGFYFFLGGGDVKICSCKRICWVLYQKKGGLFKGMKMP